MRKVDRLDADCPVYTVCVKACAKYTVAGFSIYYGFFFHFLMNKDRSI